MGIWNDRLALAKGGWSTRLILNSSMPQHPEQTSISLSANTHYWAGGLTEVNFHQATNFTVEDDKVLLLDQLSASLVEICDRARDQYRDTVPCQTGDRLPDGRVAIAEHRDETRYLRDHQNVPQPPHDGSLEIPYSNGTAYQDMLASLTNKHIYFEDRLGCAGDGRMLRDQSPRNWHYTAHPIFRRIHGQDLKFKRTTFRSLNLQQIDVANFAAHSIAYLEEQFRDYAAGGRYDGVTENGLPPGFAAREAKPRLSGLLADESPDELEP